MDLLHYSISLYGSSFRMGWATMTPQTLAILSSCPHSSMLWCEVTKQQLTINEYHGLGLISDMFLLFSRSFATCRQSLAVSF